MYHLSYFVILITSGFDNLAWIINYICDLEFSFTEPNKTKVKLQNVYYALHKPGEVYYKVLAAKAPIINAYLLSDKISCLIDFINALLDAIQHRSFIKPLTVWTNKAKADKSLIWFPDHVKTVLKRHFLPEEFGYDPQTSGMINREHYDIYIFSKKLHAEIIEMVNTVCSLIDLTTLVPVSQRQTQAIITTKHSFQNVPWVGLKAQLAMAY